MCDMPLLEDPSVRLHRRRLRFMRSALDWTRTYGIPDFLGRVYIMRQPIYLSTCLTFFPHFRLVFLLYTFCLTIHNSKFAAWIIWRICFSAFYA